MPISRHAADMDAHNYWRQFPVTAHFLEPMEIVGTLLELLEHRARDEVIPKLRIQTDDGTIVIVIAGQTRLQAELVKHGPAVGDRIRIIYTGEAGRAAPGMNRTKEFVVEVTGPGKPDAVVRTIANAAGDLESRLEQLGADQQETIKFFRRTKGLTKPLMSLTADERLLIAGELDRRGWAAADREAETDGGASGQDLFGDEPF